MIVSNVEICLVLGAGDQELSIVGNTYQLVISVSLDMMLVLFVNGKECVEFVDVIPRQMKLANGLSLSM